MKLVKSLFPVLFAAVLLLSFVPASRAQSAVSVYLGGGTAQDSSNRQMINTFGDGNFFSTPKMTGAFGMFGADFMMRHDFGFGGEYSFRLAQGPYAGLNYRPTFFDFNAIYEPGINRRRIVPEFQGGLGGATLKFYEPNNCDVLGACNSSFIESASHFEAHAAVGVRFYVTRSVFIRPQADVHWVHNFFQFGSDWVPEYTVAVGYTFGNR